MSLQLQSAAASNRAPPNFPSKPSQKVNLIAASNVSLFLSNLRLLDLDRLPDWPNITAKIFDTKDASQNQKRRISCVEWILFRLFQILDPETTRDKLQPFFPPLEPLQSINLRAALFRCLNDLKKNGLLGREAVLRKTMLDECKGEKFEELLVTFSALILRRKIVASKRSHAIPIAQALGTTDSINSTDARAILPLTLAHRISLNTRLRHRAEKKALFETFHDAIKNEHYQVQQHHKDTKEAQACLRTDLSLEMVKAIQREVQQNWAGPLEGTQLLIDGTSRDDLLSTTTYVDAMETFRKTGSLPNEPTSTNLLARLEETLKEQNHRLTLWNDYTQRLKMSNHLNGHDEASSEPTPKVTKEASADSMFTAHKSIRMDQQPQESSNVGSPGSVMRYQDIVTAVKEDITKVSKSRRGQERKSNITQTKATMGLNDVLQGSQASIAQSTPYSNDFGRIPLLRAMSQQTKIDIFSPLKDASRVPDSINSYPHVAGNSADFGLVRQQACESATSIPAHTRSGRAGQLASPEQGTPEHLATKLDRESWGESLSVPIGHTGLSDPLSLPKSPDVNVSFEESQEGLLETHDSLERRESTPESGQDIAYVSTQKSPAAETQCSTHTPAILAEHSSPTLVERTRLSIAQNSADESELLSSPSTINLETKQAKLSPPSASGLDGNASLADRTRQTILAATQGSQSGILRRQSKRDRPRESYPINQFETPIKSKALYMSYEGEADTGAGSGIGTTSTPREILFSEDAEYASVFKSRPKIALSPVVSPSNEQTGEDTTEDDFSQLESSPLRALGGNGTWGR
ncbi:HAUS augmin-like complex subunit 6 N-terminus-domain-containing protein [Delphinella strobiligena]|nr:HAUS augmin-like complex subunit 6 N-terminus-domain-containing protein [Delphinella strobiligena]